jgi:hypothetical protein
LDAPLHDYSTSYIYPCSRAYNSVYIDACHDAEDAGNIYPCFVPIVLYI